MNIINQFELNPNTVVKDNHEEADSNDLPDSDEEDSEDDEWYYKWLAGGRY